MSDQHQVGKVQVFYPDKGWGLLCVINHDELLYVNASDILGSTGFRRLHSGQIVSFDVNQTDRGPRATQVEIIYDRLWKKSS